LSKTIHHYLCVYIPENPQGIFRGYLGKDVLFIVGKLLWNYRYFIYRDNIRFASSLFIEDKRGLATDIFVGHRYTKIKFSKNGQFINSSSPLKYQSIMLKTITNFYNECFPNINKRYYAFPDNNDSSGYLIYGYKYDINTDILCNCSQNENLNKFKINGIEIFNIRYGQILNIDRSLCIIGYLYGKLKSTKSTQDCVENADVINKLYDNKDISLPLFGEVIKYIESKFPKAEKFNIVLSEPSLNLVPIL
jgi:hypothetical protein